MLQRNLLYTGITPGKRLVVLIVQKKAIAIAVRNVSGRRRWSKLDEWLRRGASRAVSTGIRVERITWGVHVPAGVLAALGGLAITGYVGAISANQGNGAHLHRFRRGGDRRHFA
jgi:ABC-type xylose transport system permease subunit